MLVLNASHKWTGLPRTTIAFALAMPALVVTYALSIFFKVNGSVLQTEEFVTEISNRRSVTMDLSVVDVDPLTDGGAVTVLWQASWDSCADGPAVANLTVEQQQKACPPVNVYMLP